MKRPWLYLTSLILFITGCNRADDDTTPPTIHDSSISFVVDNTQTSRGSVIAGTTLPQTESFRVFAWKTVGGVTTAMMAQDADNAESNVVSFSLGTWAPRRRYYWPTESGAEVDFYAVYPKDYAVSKSAGDVTIDLQIPAEVNRHKDIMTAVSPRVKLTDTANGAVSLTFRHLTAQVSFQARLAPAFGGWQVEVRGLRLCNINSRGTYSFAAHAVTPASPAVMRDYDLPMDAAQVLVNSTADAVALTSTADVAMLMPQTLTPWDRRNETASSGAPSTTGSYLAIECTITDSDGQRAFLGTTYVPLAGMDQWLAANHYNYLLEFGSGYQGDGELSVNNITVFCTISGWNDGGSGSIQVD